MTPRAFISFQMEDKWAREFLVQHAKDQDNDIEFHDYSVHEPFSEKWKTNCKERIARTHGTIVLIGSQTYSSEACYGKLLKRKDKSILYLASRSIKIRLTSFLRDCYLIELYDGTSKTLLMS